MAGAESNTSGSSGGFFRFPVARVSKGEAGDDLLRKPIAKKSGHCSQRVTESSADMQIEVNRVLECIKVGKRVPEARFSNLSTAPVGVKSVLGMFEKQVGKS